MTPGINQTVRWYLYSLLIVVVFMLVSGIIRLSTMRYSDETLRAAMVKTLTDTQGKDITLGNMVPFPGSGLSYIHSYEIASGKNGFDRAILVGLTGYSGPFAAVFAVTPTKHVIFQGLVGVAQPSNPQKYGISNRILDKWESRLEALLSNYGDNQ